MTETDRSQLRTLGTLEGFLAVSRLLLCNPAERPLLTDFLREASEVLLAFTGAEDLQLWLENGSLRYHLVASPAPGAKFFLSRVDPSRNPDPGTLVEAVLEELGGPAGFQEERREAGEGRWWTRPEECLAVLPFTIDTGNRGVLMLRRELPEALGDQELEVLEGLVRVLGTAEASRRAQAALTDRVKQLTCMYRIAQLAAEPNLSLPDTLQALVELLPPAWRYPENTAARITVDDRLYTSRDDVVPGPHCLSRELRVRGVLRGRVEIFYADWDPLKDKLNPLRTTPFQDEEHALIDGVMRACASIVDQKLAEEAESQLQAQLRHADRLATVGMLAAGVAHELNEPLANVLGFAQLALQCEGLPEQASQDVEKIVTASLYAREVIRKLMFFSRQTPSRRRPVDLDEIVREALSLLEGRFVKGGVEVELALDGALPPVHGDPAQIQQVLVNLVVNAVHAMPLGGALSVRTGCQGESVRMVFEDCGVGIPARDLEKIFVPFFTTKDVGEGTGLGLSVVHGIVTSHGGTIEVESQEGEGTRFVIDLPVSREAAEVGGEA